MPKLTRYVKGQTSDLEKEGERLAQQDSPVREVQPAYEVLRTRLREFNCTLSKDNIVRCRMCMKAWKLNGYTERSAEVLAVHAQAHASKEPIA